VTFLVAPKYKELGISEIWGKVKEELDLQLYFPDLTENKSLNETFCGPLFQH
jgi:hypothetical protein